MQAPPPGHSAADGINGPLNPFVITPPPSDGKEDEIPGYVKSLPAGTLLPKGANFAMQSTIDFGLHFPKGTKVPGGFLLPVSVVKKQEPKKVPPPAENPLCIIQ
ncbi:hypothetical protein I312_101909 [Cryptococcus bacillisporus CA1280]|uniref:uncharacterized protein n=1 Tax=Cryptococcus bacillisporus CA1280 TaxID=1296109 RepID=UPI0033660FEE